MKLTPLFLLLWLSCSIATAQPHTLHSNQHISTQAYTVIANPGENASRSVRLNWHTDLGSGDSFCFYTPVASPNWERAKSVKAKQELCTVYDSLYSQKASGEDFYENVRFLRNTVELDKLKANTEYMYRVGSNNEGEVRYFKTAPKLGVWSAAVIADMHAYTPLPDRVERAMSMLNVLELCNEEKLDLIVHVGDICAWGGSYSFWRDLYARPQFSNYTWAGVNGNHDSMSRKYMKVTNDFFRYVNNNPTNGYQGEEGVSYFFKYANTLFIMLNSEAMRSDEGVDQAQAWTREVIANNPAQFVVVVEHYQWFFGNDGKTSQYSRWNTLFDECGVDLAIGANNHIYVRTNALYQGKETDGSKGTVYLQVPSSDNERGQELKPWTDNKDLIKFRWSEGVKTVGAVLLKGTDEGLQLTLHDRQGNVVDTVSVPAVQ